MAPARMGQKAMFATDPRRGIGAARAGQAAAGSSQRAAQLPQHTRPSTAQQDAARRSSDPGREAGAAAPRSASGGLAQHGDRAAAAAAVPRSRSTDARARAMPAAAMAGGSVRDAVGGAALTQAAAQQGGRCGRGGAAPAAPQFGPVVQFSRWRLIERPPSPKRRSRSTKSQARILTASALLRRDTGRCSLLHSGHVWQQASGGVDLYMHVAAAS